MNFDSSFLYFDDLSRDISTLFVANVEMGTELGRRRKHEGELKHEKKKQTPPRQCPRPSYRYWLRGWGKVKRV
jgi:hypothetical protein